MPCPVSPLRMVAMLLLSLWVTSFPAAFAQPAPHDDFATRLVRAAHERTTHEVRYDGSYRRLDYPCGDVPDDRGVCTDVVIRAYRVVGVDLQRRVHEDRRGNLDAYPLNWGPPKLDANIQHRRVPNLRTFLRRQGAALPMSRDAADYQPGDLVTWMLPGNLPHIGIVSDRRSDDGQRPLIVHNIGRGPEVEDVLFAYPLTEHFRYDENTAGPVDDACSK